MITNSILDRAKKVYVGRDHVCRCGCAGVYHEQGTRGFKMAITRAKKLLEENSWRSYDEVNATYVNFISGKDRAITVYFEN